MDERASNSSAAACSTPADRWDITNCDAEPQKGTKSPGKSAPGQSSRRVRHLEQAPGGSVPPEGAGRWSPWNSARGFDIWGARMVHTADRARAGSEPADRGANVGGRLAPTLPATTGGLSPDAVDRHRGGGRSSTSARLPSSGRAPVGGLDRLTCRLLILQRRLMQRGMALRD